jgi:hypothetical protein
LNMLSLLNKQIDQENIKKCSKKAVERTHE